MTERFDNMKRQITPSDEVIEKTLERAENEKKKSRPYVKYITAAACVALVCAAALTAYNGKKPALNGGTDAINTPETGIAETVPATSAATSPAIAQNNAETEIAPDTVPDLLPDSAGCYAAPWDSMEIYQQYSFFKYGEKEYDCICDGETLAPEDIGEKIQDIELTGHDFEKNEVHTAKAELFKIKNVSEKAFIALKYEGNPEYYAFNNTEYSPDDLKQYISDTDMLNRFEIESIDIHRIENGMANMDKTYSLADGRALAQLIFGESEKRIKVSASRRGVTEVQLYGTYRGLMKNASITISNNGYMLVSGVDYEEKCFDIGTEKAAKIKEYIQLNGTVTADYSYDQAVTAACSEPGGQETLPPTQPPAGEVLTTGELVEVMTSPPYNPQEQAAD
ncbi:MAG: hypothetical protein MJ177_02915 [Clostridia bacterium]|nr:hypothetical protein [Clostridia bacterium]